MTIHHFRAILQAVDGSLKGQIAQVLKVLDDGSIECFCRAFDGTPTLFKIPASDIEQWRATGGVAVIGPRAEQAASLPPPAPVATAPLNPEDLLEPLPPTVKATPMNEVQPAPNPLVKNKGGRPRGSKEPPYTGPKAPWEWWQPKPLRPLPVRCIRIVRRQRWMFRHRSSAKHATTI